MYSDAVQPKPRYCQGHACRLPLQQRHLQQYTRRWRQKSGSSPPVASHSEAPRYVAHGICVCMVKTKPLPLRTSHDISHCTLCGHPLCSQTHILCDCPLNNYLDLTVLIKQLPRGPCRARGRAFQHLPPLAPHGHTRARPTLDRPMDFGP